MSATAQTQQGDRWEALNRWVAAAIGLRSSGEYQEAMADVKNEMRRLERRSMPYQWEPVHETAESAVRFALGLVARFEGDDQCVLNRYHSEALSFEARRLTDELEAERRKVKTLADEIQHVYKLAALAQVNEQYQTLTRLAFGKMGIALNDLLGMALGLSSPEPEEPK